MGGSDQHEPETLDEVVLTDIQVIEPVTCMVCGCLCDDIAVVKEGEVVREARNACALGSEWYLRDRSEDDTAPVARINGAPVEASEAVERAAALLAAARAPVILGLTWSTSETVAAALDLADRIGAAIEPSDVRMTLPQNLAFQRTGRVSATLGEVKNRADVVVFWGADPLVTHPRHWERYSVEPRGRFVPEGRAGRTVIVVDEKRTATAERADLFVEIDPKRQLEVLWVLRALVRGVELDAERVVANTGCRPDHLRQLASRLTKARYGAFFQGSLLGRGKLSQATATIEAANSLVRDLNGSTRFVTLGMGAPGNPQGAEAVLTWQTGFAMSVELGAGHPAFVPNSTSAHQRLYRGEADLALIVGRFNLDALEPEARTRLDKIPVVAIAPSGDVEPRPVTPEVACHAAIPGFEEVGTVTRIDGVSVHLRPIRSARLPTERQWLEAINQFISSRTSC
jgi:formylmethanofuran dehydrogenase subunit B